MHVAQRLMQVVGWT